MGKDCSFYNNIDFFFIAICRIQEAKYLFNIYLNMYLWSNGLVVKALDYQSRDPV